MKQVVLWELRDRRRYLIGWCIAMVALMLLLMLIYPAIHDQADKLNSVLNSLPAAIKNLKTGSSSVDISSPVGYLNSQVFYATLPLFFIIMSIGLGSSLLAHDEQNHTLELLLARPLSRGQVLAAKALAGLICLFTVALVATVIIMILAPFVKMNIGTGHLVLASLYSLLFSLTFGAIAYALTALSNSTRHLATALATVLSFGGYIMATLGSLTHYLQTPAKLLPYHYYAPDRILQGQVDTGLTIYIIGCLIICSLAAWLGFRRRDIY